MKGYRKKKPVKFGCVMASHGAHSSGRDLKNTPKESIHQFGNGILDKIQIVLTPFGEAGISGILRSWTTNLVSGNTYGSSTFYFLKLFDSETNSSAPR